jgi:hypothetical protein
MVLCLCLDEDVDGEAYVCLTECVLVNQMKLKVGQVMKIKKHLESLNAVVSCDCFFLLKWLILFVTAPY